VEKGQRYDAELSLAWDLPKAKESEEAKDFRQKLQARFWLSTGQSKEEVAERLGKACGWVTQAAGAAPEIPRAVPRYVAEYNLRMLSLGIEPFRPALLWRRYAEDTEGLYLECAQQMPWRQAVFRKRNYETGEVTVTGIASNRQDCSYPTLATGIPRLDVVLQRLKRDLQIQDPRAFLLNNFYPEGNTSIAPHQHDFWSAILSLGASRVFTLDGSPVLLGDGDVLVIGTQRHGVPKMPEVEDGRVSVAIFWYPESAPESLGSRPADADPSCAMCGAKEQLQEAEDGSAYCRACWQQWQDDAEEAMLQTALERSMQEQ
ncbi:unnamed protein product, partial [Effrenium voratum]